LDAPLLNLLVALGVGMLIGIGRERATGHANAPTDAGLRTFSIAALGGAVAVACGGVALLAVVAAAVAGLVGISYWRNREEGPGLTTEFAILLTVLTGALAMKAPSAAGAVGIVVALLLSSRENLHHFVRTVLTEDEVRSALILGAALIVVMPLLPDQQMGPYEALNPKSVWRLVVLVLLIGALGHLATRVLGARFGLPISGLASGFVSSSATIGAMGARAAKDPKVMTSAVAGAVLSTVATVIQMAVVVGATSPAALRAMAAPLIGAGLAAGAYGAVFTLAALRTPPPEDAQKSDSAFSLTGALIFALTLSVVLLASAALRAEFGETGAILAAGVAGFVDTHAPAISIASLAANGRMAAQDVVVPILAGFTTNTVTKIVVAAASGGRAFALRVAPGVILVAAAAWAGALVGHVTT
jgi:uncharacterized membrane protein (DUF4010 family)